MKRATLLLISLFLPLATLAGCAGSEAPEIEATYPPSTSLEQIQSLIQRLPAQHPRLLIDREGFAELRDSIDRFPLSRDLAKYVVEVADLLQNVPPVERQLTGRRLLGQSRTCLKRVITLALAYRLTEEGRYLLRAEEEMLAAAAFSDWNPDHFLDVAEMSLALALGYDWLYDDLSESSRRQIREALVSKALMLPFETKHTGWIDSTNNWGQVCHGGLTAAALALLEDEPEVAARTVHSAIHNVTHSMAVYAPKGSYPEGPGYWSYGTSYNVILIALLESALRTDFGLSQAPGFARTGGYLPLMTGPSGLFFNYSDGGAERSPQSALFWFAERFDRPAWLLGEAEQIRSAVDDITPARASGQSHRLLPLGLIWLRDLDSSDLEYASRTERVEEEIDLPLHWFGEGEVPVTVHRSSWKDPARTFVGLKGGAPNANHGQMDIGSFVLDSDGVRWAVDLGAEAYHGIESRGMNLWNRSQNSDRWTIFRQMNQGHNTLVIGGRLQNAAGHGSITAFSAESRFPHSILDMSEVYEDQADSVRRGIGLVNEREVLIQDELTGLEEGAEVRWGMITPGLFRRVARGVLELRQGPETLILTILEPNEVDWRIIDISEPREEWDSPNPGLRMIALQMAAPESGQLSCRVLATPGSVTDSVAAEIEGEPLSRWGQRGG